MRYRNKKYLVSIFIAVFFLSVLTVTSSQSASRCASIASSPEIVSATTISDRNTGSILMTYHASTIDVTATGPALGIMDFPHPSVLASCQGDEVTITTRIIRSSKWDDQRYLESGTAKMGPELLWQPTVHLAVYREAIKTRIVFSWVMYTEDGKIVTNATTYGVSRHNYPILANTIIPADPGIDAQGPVYR